MKKNLIIMLVGIGCLIGCSGGSADETVAAPPAGQSAAPVGGAAAAPMQATPQSQ